MTLGEKLRSLRAVSGWTQPECAEKIGIEQSYLSKLENDKSIPSAEIFDALCATYKVSPDEVIKDLDKAYIRKNLMHIPMVSISTNGHSEQVKQKRKRNVLYFSGFILLGVLLFTTSKLQLISNDHVYEYFSRGIDYKSEINQCLKTKDAKECFIKYTEVYESNIFPRSTLNFIPDTLIIKEYKGDKFRVNLKQGFREYQHRSDYNDAGKTNKILILLSILMFTLGILGLFIEVRFYRIDKQ